MHSQVENFDWPSWTHVGMVKMIQEEQEFFSSESQDFDIPLTLDLSMMNEDGNEIEAHCSEVQI